MNHLNNSFKNTIINHCTTAKSTIFKVCSKKEENHYSPLGFFGRLRKIACGSDVKVPLRKDATDIEFYTSLSKAIRQKKFYVSDRTVTIVNTWQDFSIKNRDGRRAYTQIVDLFLRFQEFEKEHELDGSDSVSNYLKKRFTLLDSTRFDTLLRKINKETSTYMSSTSNSCRSSKKKRNREVNRGAMASLIKRHLGVKPKVERKKKKHKIG